MSIKIEIFGETASEALAELTAFAGGLTSRPVHEITAAGGASNDTSLAEAVARIAQEQKPVTAAQTLDLAAETAEAPKRERGKPSPGRARRTKEEIAEDEAAEASAPTEPTMAISTGEERVDPADVAAQDAQDEAEEAAASKPADVTYTNDDLKAEMTAYVQKYGMPAVQEDGPKIYAVLGNPPAGEAAWKLSLVGDNQALLAKAVPAWREAVANNPFKRG